MSSDALVRAFERIVAYVYLVHGVSVVFAESTDTIDRDLRRVRPTVMTAVPRVFEKMQARVLAAGSARGIFQEAARPRPCRRKGWQTA